MEVVVPGISRFVLLLFFCFAAEMVFAKYTGNNGPPPQVKDCTNLIDRYLGKRDQLMCGKDKKMYWPVENQKVTYVNIQCSSAPRIKSKIQLLPESLSYMRNYKTEEFWNTAFFQEQVKRLKSSDCDKWVLEGFGAVEPLRMNEVIATTIDDSSNYSGGGASIAPYKPMKPADPTSDDKTKKIPGSTAQ